MKLVGPRFSHSSCLQTGVPWIQPFLIPFLFACGRVPRFFPLSCRLTCITFRGALPGAPTHYTGRLWVAFELLCLSSSERKYFPFVFYLTGLKIHASPVPPQPEQGMPCAALQAAQGTLTYMPFPTPSQRLHLIIRETTELTLIRPVPPHDSQPVSASAMASICITRFLDVSGLVNAGLILITCAHLICIVPR